MDLQHIGMEEFLQRGAALELDFSSAFSLFEFSDSYEPVAFKDDVQIYDRSEYAAMCRHATEERRFLRHYPVVCKLLNVVFICKKEAMHQVIMMTLYESKHGHVALDEKTKELTGLWDSAYLFLTSGMGYYCSSVSALESYGYDSFTIGKVLLDEKKDQMDEDDNAIIGDHRIKVMG